MKKSFLLIACIALYSIAANAQIARPRCTPTVKADITVVSAAARKYAASKTNFANALQFGWPDTPLGVIKENGEYKFFASDGFKNYTSFGHRVDGGVVMSIGTLDNPLQKGLSTDGSIAPNPDPTVNPEYSKYHYLGGGPVYRVPEGLPGANNLLMVTHAEIPTPNTKPNPSFYSILGLASSTDNGRSWVALGEIIRINLPYSPDMQGFEIGDAPLVTTPNNGFFRIYFQDLIRVGTSSTFRANRLSVAEAPVLEVLKAAFGLHPHAATFKKYYHGDWDQPGIGGLSTDLDPKNTGGNEHQVVFSSWLNSYIMVSGSGDKISYLESDDGLVWGGNEVTLRAFPPKLGRTYVTPVGDGSNPHVISNPFYVFYTWYPNEGGWEKAELRRLTIQCK